MGAECQSSYERTDAAYRLGLQAYRPFIHRSHRWHFNRSGDLGQLGDERRFSRHRILRYCQGISAMFLDSICSSIFNHPKQVYYKVPALQEAKKKARGEPSDAEDESSISQNLRHIRKEIQRSLQDFKFYFHHRAFLPSFAGALLYLTALSFAGQMVTYLLSAGYSATHVGLARTLSVAFEVSATWLAPSLMSKIGPIRSGIWLLSWQMICLGAGLAVFWALADRPLISASGLVGGTILSRVGLRGFDLCTQIIIQEVCAVRLRRLWDSPCSSHNPSHNILCLL